MKMKASASSSMMQQVNVEIDIIVRESAIKLKDTDLLAKLAGGDTVAIEDKYHVKCLAVLYNRIRKLQKPSTDEDSNENSLHTWNRICLTCFIP